MSHTNGHWKVSVWDYPHATPPRKELNIENEAQLIATLQCDFIGDNPYTIPQSEAEANARLIAAAPDLLAALERLVRLCPSDEGLGGHAPLSAFYDVAFHARQALAKAKGAPCLG